MGTKIRVLLVRHGQSEANLDWEVNARKADHAIELTEKGHEQARAAGDFLAKYLVDEEAPRRIWDNTEHIALPKVRLWNSPYLRTRQTAQRILETALVPGNVPVFMGEVNQGAKVRKPGETVFFDDESLEHEAMHEQLFGIFDGLSDEERAARFPTEWAHYQKCKSFEGKVWARMPGGESRMDVAVRMRGVFGSFQRDFERHGVQTIVVVAHGTVNRAFTMVWTHKTWEFLEKEPNPNNCSVRLLEDGKDCGYIFDGFPPEGDG